MPFKVGGFNLLPTFAIVTLCVAGIGAAPYGVRRLISGEVRVPVACGEREGWAHHKGDERGRSPTPPPLPPPQWPTIQDDFERYAKWRAAWLDPGSPHSATKDFQSDAARPVVEAGWAARHRELGNLK